MIKKSDVALFEIAKKLRGLQTVSTISKNLGVKNRTAINFAWKLRKKGYLNTDYARNKIRLYWIDPLKREKRGYSLQELINKNSKVKISTREDYIIHADEEPCVEEVLARAINTKEFRIILASLALFNKIKKWSRLKEFADKYKIGRQVGALYDVAKKTIRVRRMDERTRKSLLKSKGEKFIIKNFKSKSFTDIEKKWKVFIPFNKQDLEIYEEWST